MKNILLLLSVIILASCSAVYKSGQTPDDLYYSKPNAVVVKNTNRYKKHDIVYEERQIRMAAYDYRWRALDDRYDYNNIYSPYNYGFNYGYYYNPYYLPFPVYGQSVVFVNPKNTTIRKTNLASYSITVFSATPTKSSNILQTSRNRGYNNSNNQTYEGGRYDSRTYNDNRTYSPSTNNSSGSSSGGGSAPASTGTSVPRPPRGGQ